MPNLFAFAVLALWPAVSFLLFRRLPVGRALIASFIVAYLFLPPPPTGFDLPLVPAMTKETLPTVVAALLCVLLYRDGLRILPETVAGRILVLAFILSPLGTVLTNPEPIFFGRFGLPGLRPREALGMMIGQAILILPYLLARNYLARAEDHRDLLFALMIGGLAYSLPMLVEVRLSPQINVWVYGFFQHHFDQMMRYGGFRPIVFLYHGLWVAFFAMTAVLAAAAFLRHAPAGRKVLMAGVTLYLLVVLVLCKSAASLLYALAFLPVILVLRPRAQMRLALVMAAFALVYPVAKAAHLVPEAEIVALARSISDDRAGSLQFRFDNENVLADRAYAKPLFGWGLWGRHHILDETTGRYLTVTDGRWILVLGVLGWVGFLAEFGLLTLPLFLMWRYSAAMAADEAAGLAGYSSALAIILAINVIDLIPNATLTPLTWLAAGAILGRAEVLRRVTAAAPLRRPAPLRTVL
jgi:hypothetical protein